MSNKNSDSLSHSRWNCKYHIVFAPKYRRQVIYQALKSDIGKILRTLCDQKKVEIHEAEACPDHIHMLVSIPPNLSVSQFMGYLKSKSSLMIFDRHANLKSGPPAQPVVLIEVEDSALLLLNRFYHISQGIPQGFRNYFFMVKIDSQCQGNTDNKTDDCLNKKNIDCKKDPEPYRGAIIDFCLQCIPVPAAIRIKFDTGVIVSQN